MTKQKELLTFKLLGGLSIKRNGEPLNNLASRKAEALLAYLACNQQEHSRETLATLLWDDRPLSRSLGNLSVLLSSLRKETADHIQISRSSLAFNPDSDYLLDSQQFETKINQARQQQAGQPLRTAAAQLTQALDLYQGRFLAGFHIREARDFEEWVILEQERLQRLAIDSLADLVEFHLSRNQTQEGIEQAARLLALDSLHEAGHRQLMRLLALDGRRNAALAQYESCCQILENELGVEPAESTVALYEQIRSGEWNINTKAGSQKQSAISVLQGTSAPIVPLHNLPAQTSTFIGREQELSQIARRLEDPACRLLTLVGHGGIGKTRLSLEAANRQVGRFLHGVWFVGLAGLSSGDGLAPVIADTLGLAYTGRSGLEEELFDYLQQKEMLLVLDNFEQLLEDDTAPNFIQDLLIKVPNVSLLITSRESISLSTEWLVSVDGLPYPAEGQQPDPTRFEAVQLFLQRAQQADGAFTAETASLDPVQKICYLVQGIPLALELAASWLRVYSSDQIADQLEQDLSFLNTRFRDIPLRHRSLQAIFDHSWQLLDTAEQQLLRQLAVFQGGFSSEAVLAVTDEPEEKLIALVDKSLIRQSQNEAGQNRYDFHEILRQFAASRLKAYPEDKQQAQDKHGRYYALFCVEQESHLKSGQAAEALETVTEEMDNLQAAWRWTFSDPTAPQSELLSQMLEGFLIFFDMRGRFQEGLVLSQEAAEAMTSVELPKDPVLSGRLLAWEGWFNFRISNYEKGQALAEKGLALIQEAGAWQFTAYPLLFLGAAAFGMGKLPLAQDLTGQSLEVYRKLEDGWGISGTLSNLGHIATAQGDFEAAEKYLLECLAVTEANDILYLYNRGLQTLGSLYTTMGKNETARESLEQALEVSRAIGDKYSLAMTLLDLGKNNINLGNDAAAVKSLEEGRAVFAEIGERLNESWTLIYLGEIAFKQHKPGEARQYWGAALQIGRKIRASAIILAAVNGLARLRLSVNNKNEMGLALLAYVKNHPETEHFQREEASAYFEKMASNLAAQDVETAESLAESWDLEDVVAHLYTN